MKMVTATVLLVLAAGCSDVVAERYASVEDARRAGLFDRGWLPDVLPPSAHDIEVRHDLDLNVLAGEFLVSKSDFERFTARLVPYSTESLDADVHLAAYLDAQKIKGLRAGVVRESDYIWAFVCDPQTGRCTYTLAAER